MMDVVNPERGGRLRWVAVFVAVLAITLLALYLVWVYWL